MLDLIVIGLIFALVFYSNKRASQTFGPLHAPGIKRFLDRLFLYHCVFSCLFQLIPGDATGYWNFGFQQLTVHSDNMKDYFGVGTTFLLFLDFIPARIMGLSFFTANIIYGVFGFLGLRYLYFLFVGSLKVNVEILGKPVIPWLFYLPNMNFWTAGLGKDTLCFFGIACFLYSMQAYRKRLIPLVLSFALVYYIRPHMGMMIIAGAGVGIVFSREMKPVYKLLFLLLTGVGFFLIYQKVAQFLMVEDLSVANLSGLARDQAFNLSRGNAGSSVDLSSYPEPLRLFTYLYRPLFFDVHNIIGLAASLENVLYIVITVKGIQALRRRDIRVLPIWLKTGFVISMLSMLVFANSLGNLGIIMRMKNMTMIYLLMVCIWLVNRRRQEALGITAVPAK